MQGSTARDVQIISRLKGVPNILEVVTHLTGMRFAAIARVTDTTWTACATLDRIEFGLVAGGELDLQTTICNEIRQHQQTVIIENVALDEKYVTHHTPLMYGFKSYISVPIFRSNGEFFGTLCAIDPEPAKLSDPNIQRTFELFTQLIVAQYEMEERLMESQDALVIANDMAKLREQFIAVLGHDLRSPLQAVSMGTDVLRKLVLDPAAQRAIDLIGTSSQRMAELIDNILDFARGRLGGGIPVALEDNVLIAEHLHELVQEVQGGFPDRRMDVRMDVAGPVRVDARRLAQLVANLLANAMAHGAPEEPVRLRVSRSENRFEISVQNFGAPIPPEKMANLFLPFTRSATDAPQPGLGLGLYIAAEIAKAHGGTLAVESTMESGTRFTFSMPLVVRDVLVA